MPFFRSLKKKVRSLKYIINSFFAIIAIVTILWLNITGTFAATRLLHGVGSPFNKLEGTSSTAIIQFLRERLINPNAVKAYVSKTVESGKFVAYLDLDEDQQSTAPLRFDRCTKQASVDSIYNYSFASDLVTKIVKGYGLDLNFSSGSHLLLVDCTFAGRSKEDNTIFKVYLIDSSFDYISAITLQTCIAETSSRVDRTSSGPAIVSNTSLADIEVNVDFAINDVFKGLVAIKETAFKTVISLGYPFVNHSFQEMDILQISSTGGWNAKLIDDDAQVHLTLYTGFYRDSPNEQANFNKWTFGMNSNPIHELQSVQWVGYRWSKNSWSWAQALLSAGLSFAILESIAVAVIIVYQTRKSQKVLWIPDISPAVQSGIMIRGILTLYAWYIDEYWGLEEWCQAAAYDRTQYDSFTVLHENMRSDFLSVFLMIASMLAKLLHLRINPAIPVSIFIVSYKNHREWSGNMGIYKHIIDSHIDLDRLQGVYQQKNNSGLALRNWFERKNMSITVVGNELTWFFIGILILFSYMVCVLLWSKTIGKHSSYSKSRMVYAQSSSTSYSSKAYMQSSDLCSSSASGMENDASVTCFESSIGELLNTKFGLMVHHENYMFMKGLKYATPSGIWTSGWVIVDSKYLFRVNDWSKAVFNRLLKKNLFQIYCHPVKDNHVDKTLLRVYPYNSTLRAYFHVSLRPLAGIPKEEKISLSAGSRKE